MSAVGGLAPEIGFISIYNGQIGGVLWAVSAVCVGPISMRSRLFTMPEFLERRDGRGARQIFGWKNLGQSLLPQPSGDCSDGLATSGRFNFSSGRLSQAGISIGVTVGTDAEMMGDAADAMLGRELLPA